MNISINIDTIKRYNNDVNTLLEDFDNEINNIKKYVEETKEYWYNKITNQGDGEIFRQKMAEFCYLLTSFRIQINSYCDFLDSYIQAEETLNINSKSKSIELK